MTTITTAAAFGTGWHEGSCCDCCAGYCNRAESPGGPFLARFTHAGRDWISDRYQFGVGGWSHRLRCVETLTAGHLGREIGGLSDCAAALGIDTPAAHTALGDARTARAIWDAILGGSR